jgi:multiple sugar transport system substrate-binding protein
MAMPLSRRDLLKAGIATGGALALPGLLSERLSVAPVEAARTIQLSMLQAGDIHTLRLMQKLMDAFHKRYPNIVVKPSVTPWANFDQRVDLLLAAGTPPAVWWPGANRGYRYYAARNYFPSIDGQLAASHYSLTDFYKPLIDFCIWKGHHVGLPADYSSGILVYNKTLFDKAGLSYPPTDWNDKTWDYDKFLEYAKALTVRKGGKMVQWGTDAPITDSRFPFWIFGGDAFDEQAYVTGYPTKVTLNTPAVIDGLQFQRDLIVKWKAQPTPAEAQAATAGAPSLFQTGKIGMEVTANWVFAPPGYSQIKQFEWGVAAVPWPPKRYGLPRKMPLYPDQWMVFKGQKYPKEAWELQSWLAGPEGMRLYSQGTGLLPARKSLAETTRTLLKGYKPGITKAELEAVLSSVNYGHITPSHAIVNWPAIGDQAVNPVFQSLQLGHLTGKQAMEQMSAKILAVLKQYPAPK